MLKCRESIFKRNDGRWEARISEQRENGKRYYRSLYGKNYIDVKKKMEEYCKEKDTEFIYTSLNSDYFSHIVQCWLTSVKGTVKDSTYTRYYRNVYSYILPVFGMYEIFEIGSTSINSFKNNLLENGGKRGKGLSAKTVTDILSVLKIILSYAAEEGYRTVNTKLIRNPRKKKNEIAVISKEKIDALEKVLLRNGDNISVGILLTLHTGIRNGELCGLRWDDIDFNYGIVKIRRTVERISKLSSDDGKKTEIVINEPKTETSKRDIPLPWVLCDYLRAKRGTSGTFLLTGTEKPTEPHTLYVRYKRFLRRHGFEEYTFHALRHTFATRGIESGFDVKSLSEILGHSDVTTTMRCYVHPSAEQKRKQMENMFDVKNRGQRYVVKNEAM